MNPMDLRRGINLAVEHVLADLKGRAKMISTTEEIAQVLSAIKSCSNLENDNQTAQAADENLLTALQACIAACQPLTCQQCIVQCEQHFLLTVVIAAYSSTHQHASHFTPVLLLKHMHL